MKQSGIQPQSLKLFSGEGESRFKDKQLGSWMLHSERALKKHAEPSSCKTHHQPNCNQSAYGEGLEIYIVKRYKRKHNIRCRPHWTCGKVSEWMAEGVQQNSSLETWGWTGHCRDQEEKARRARVEMGWTDFPKVWSCGVSHARLPITHN